MNVSVKKVSQLQIALMERQSKSMLEKQSELKDVEDLHNHHIKPSISTIRYGGSDIVPSSDKTSNQQQKKFPTTKKILAYGPTQIHPTFPSQTIPNNYLLPFQHTTCRKKILLLITFLVIVAVCCVAILPPVLILRQKDNSVSSSFTAISVSTCSRSTCIGQETPYHTSMTTLSYAFDGNLYASTGSTGATALGVPPSKSFSIAAMSGLAYFLSSFYFEYLSIPYVNLSQQSFTFEIWIEPYINNATTDIGIFSQCGSMDNICFSLSIRNYHVVLSFDAANPNDVPLIGSTIIPFYLWTHITIVYDAVALQQLIYVNGRIDAVSTGMVKPYQGTPAGIATTTIGFSSSYVSPVSYFYGYIDQLTISSGTVRSASQILNDASLLAYFPFDKSDQLLDHSVYNNYGYTINVGIFLSGRIQQAISFNLSTSYFQSQCFPSIRTTTPFTVSLWINPMSETGGGTIVHLSSLQNGTGTPCYDLLALTSSGHIVAQLMYSFTNVTDFLGPILPNDTWTHIAVVYGSANGMRLFVNGVVSAISYPYAYMPVLYSAVFITLGNTNPKGPTYSVNCPAGNSTGFVSGPFTGAIDDFRLYIRELDAQEICVLANM